MSLFRKRKNMWAWTACGQGRCADFGIDGVCTCMQRWVGCGHGWGVDDMDGMWTERRSVDKDWMAGSHTCTWFWKKSTTMRIFPSRNAMVRMSLGSHELHWLAWGTCTLQATSGMRSKHLSSRGDSAAPPKWRRSEKWQSQRQLLLYSAPDADGVG